MLPAYHSELQKYSPVYPIIKKKQLHADIVNALESLSHMEECSSMLVQAYIQMMIAHVFSDISMVDKSSIGSDDLIYNAVEYVAKNFRDEIKLDKLRKQKGWSKEDLSARLRVSSLNSIRMGIYFSFQKLEKTSLS